jgi:hypothetical protein
MVYEPSAPIARTPLSDLVGSASSSQLNSETPTPTYGGPQDAVDLEDAGVGAWRASTRWAAVKGDGCIVVEQDSNAEAGAAKFRINRCSQQDAGQPPGGADVYSGDDIP